jgi:hypothetical protein
MFGKGSHAISTFGPILPCCHTFDEHPQSHNNGLPFAGLWRFFSIPYHGHGRLQTVTGVWKIRISNWKIDM